LSHEQLINIINNSFPGYSIEYNIQNLVFYSPLDYSVAKDGKLVAYRFNSEKKVSSENFVYV